MRERPILFSGPMVRAILDGRKTQTRRVVTEAYKSHRKDGAKLLPELLRNGVGAACPYGKPGDCLWVRESWGDVTLAFQSYECEEPQVWAFRADEAVHNRNGFLEHMSDSGIVCRRWRPSIFMPRWMSRLSLEIANVRVERLQEMSLEDAQSEGVEIEQVEQSAGKEWLPRTLSRFIAGWNALNAKRGYSWESNPWVWVIEFKRLEMEAAEAVA